MIFIAHTHDVVAVVFLFMNILWREIKSNRASVDEGHRLRAAVAGEGCVGNVESCGLWVDGGPDVPLGGCGLPPATGHANLRLMTWMGLT